MLIRIDDYPRGVKPRFKNDTKHYCDIMKIFDEYNLEYTLGVVPMLLTKKDSDLLNELKGLHIAVHGCFHIRHTMEEHLTKQKVPYERISSEMLDIALDRFTLYGLGHRITTYIPPFNNITQDIVDILIVAGFSEITTGVFKPKNIRYGGMTVHTPRAWFYGRSYEIEPMLIRYWAPCEHICLHITWEHNIHRVDPSQIRRLAETLAHVTRDE